MDIADGDAKEPVLVAARTVEDAIDANVLLKVPAQINERDFTARMLIDPIDREVRGAHTIGITGKVVPGERQRCVEAGANDYVPKPVDTLELLAALGPWPSSAGRV